MHQSSEQGIQELQEQTTFWRDPALNDLELLQATYIRHSFTPHSHEGYAIGVIESGVERFRCRRETYIAPEGSVVIINPDEVHTGAAAVERGWTYRMLYPDVPLLLRAATTSDGRVPEAPFFPSPVVHDPLLASMIFDLHRTLAASSSALERESKLIWTLANLIRRHADPHLIRLFPSAKAQFNVQRARSYLDAHYFENVSLSQLAQLAGLSPFHLLRIFRETIGLPPHSYLTQLRIMHAKRLIADAVPLAEVAAIVGFSDQSHLTRHFKAVVGVTPGSYARSYARAR